jgi:CubicO group peptidase (beta-lactamase class C family)
LAYGHSGFTGIWIWNDPKYKLEFIFLSNHVNPEGGSNTKLITMNVRGKVLQAVYDAMNLSEHSEKSH